MRAGRTPGRPHRTRPAGNCRGCPPRRAENIRRKNEKGLGVSAKSLSLNAFGVENVGGPCRIRTYDQRIKSHSQRRCGRWRSPSGCLFSHAQQGEAVVAPGSPGITTSTKLSESRPQKPGKGPQRLRCRGRDRRLVTTTLGPPRPRHPCCGFVGTDRQATDEAGTSSLHPGASAAARGSPAWPKKEGARRPLRFFSSRKSPVSKSPGARPSPLLVHPKQDLLPSALA